MKIAEKIWEPVRRAGLRVLGGNEAPAPKRKTVPLPSILQTFGTRAELLPKKTPEALRRFAETPIARKAINTIKDRVAGMNWRIQPRRGRVLDEEMQERIQVLTETLEQPNPDDSFRSFARAGSGGHHRGRIWRDGAAADRRRAEAAGAVSGGRGDDPDAGGLEWRSGRAALCADDWAVGAGAADRAERQRAVVHPAEPAQLYAVWTGAAGGCVRDDSRVSGGASLCGQAGEQLGGAVRAVDAGAGSGTA